MSTSWRSIRLILLIGLLASGAAFVTLRAAEQSAQPAPAADSKPAPTKDAKTAPAKDAKPAPAKDAKPASQGPAPGDPDSIKDDPTVAPDPQESADNAVTYPVDT
jgi:hypothetical protein